MLNFFTSPSLSLSLVTILSLLVNAITIYKWISENKKDSNINDQSYQMVMGLTKANSKRSNVIVNRMNALKEQGKEHDEAMLFLENMYADSMSNIESLLATAKALKPSLVSELPFDGQGLLAMSMKESAIEQLGQKDAEDKLKLDHQKNTTS